MKILYFARMRQAMGRASENVDVPAGIETVSALIDFLKARDEQSAHAFADLRTVKAAINQAHAPLDARLDGATEIAFFPPVTGG
jgi:sulfur-carrier protein